MQVEIGGAGVLSINRQIGCYFVQKEGFIIGIKAIVGAAVERLRAICGLVLCIAVPIDRDKLLLV